MNTQPQRSRAGEAVLILATIALQGWYLYLTLPPQQRLWLRLTVLGTVRQRSARIALLLGWQGMGEELATGQKSARYLAALWFSLGRDWANRQIEAMRP